MKTFSDLGLLSPIQRALQDLEYTTPTPIQAQTLPIALDGCDVLGCAQTGTGKTAAFSLPILHQLGKKKRRAIPNQPYALILAPTRELAGQVHESLVEYSEHLQLRHAVIYGGVSQFHQVRALKRGVHVLIATPGRLLDLINQKHIKLDRLEMFVLDEADRMLDIGFLPDLKRLVKLLPKQRQSLFFSATMTPEIISLAGSMLTDPVHVNVAPETKCVDQIQQSVLFLKNNEKQDKLHQILSDPSVGQTLVFTKTKRGANKVTEELQAGGIRASVIHGNKSQSARQRALKQFRDVRVQVLVATDVAARGIDVEGVTHVINYDVPVEAESYVHRIGRTGRAGAEGIAMTLCSNQEYRELKSIEKFLGESIPVDPEHTRPERESNNKRKRSPKQHSQRRSKPRSESRRGNQNAPSGNRPRRPKRKPSRKTNRTPAAKG